MGKYCVSLIFAVFLHASFVATEKVVIDLYSQSDRKLIDVTCLYTEDYNDFWVFGYPVHVAPENDRYPDVRGFWTPGQAQRCEIHYYGGVDMPAPKALTLGYYRENQPQILVSGKHNLEAETSTEVEVAVKNEDTWEATTIDLSSYGGLVVFNFTLISMGDDVLLLDQIILDLGEETTQPTEAPPSSTRNPIDDDTAVLDTSDDLWSIWDDGCNYIDEYEYFWVFGCPFEPASESTNQGYWSPCNKKRCTLRLSVDNTLLSTPQEIKVRSYMEKGAQINVTINLNPGGNNATCTTDCTVLQVITTDSDGWVETLISQDGKSDSYIIDFEMIPTEPGSVVIDKISLGTSGTSTEPSPGDGSSGTVKLTSPTYFVATILLFFVAVSY